MASGFGGFLGGLAQGAAQTLTWGKMQEIQAQKEAQGWLAKLQKQQDFQKEMAAKENENMFKRMQAQADIDSEKLKKAHDYNLAEEDVKNRNQIEIEKLRLSGKPESEEAYTPSFWLIKYNTSLEDAQSLATLMKGGRGQEAAQLVKTKGYKLSDAEKQAALVQYREEISYYKNLAAKRGEESLVIQRESEKRLSEREARLASGKQASAKGKVNFQSLRSQAQRQWDSALKAGNLYLKQNEVEKGLSQDQIDEIMSSLESGANLKDEGWFGGATVTEAKKLTLGALKSAKETLSHYNDSVLSSKILTPEDKLALLANAGDNYFAKGGKRYSLADMMSMISLLEGEKPLAQGSTLPTEKKEPAKGGSLLQQIKEAEGE